MGAKAERNTLITAIVFGLLALLCFVFGILAYLDQPNDRTVRVYYEEDIVPAEVPAYMKTGVFHAPMGGLVPGTYRSSPTHGPADWTQWKEGFYRIDPVVICNHGQWTLVGDICHLQIEWTYDGRFGTDMAGVVFPGTTLPTDEVVFGYERGDLWPAPVDYNHARDFRIFIQEKHEAMYNQFTEMKSVNWGGRIDKASVLGNRPDEIFRARMTWREAFVMLFSWPSTWNVGEVTYAVTVDEFNQAFATQTAWGSGWPYNPPTDFEGNQLCTTFHMEGTYLADASSV